MRSFTLTGWSGVGSPWAIDWNTGVADTDGNIWLAPDINGWDGPDIAFDFAHRWGGPGQVANAGEPIGRTLSVQRGLLIATSEEARNAGRDKIAALLASMTNPDSMGQVLVHDVTSDPLATLDRYVNVYCTQKPILQDMPPGPGSIGGVGAIPDMWPCQVTWVVQSPDPFKYANVEQSYDIADSVGHEAVNFGTAATAPVFHLNLPGPSVSINHSFTGRTILLSSATMPSQLHIDVGARTIVDGAGVDRYDTLISTPDQWFMLLPGLGFNVITVVGVTGSPGGSVTWHPAWA